jgi:DNA-binding PadR family transcriptional regulator
MNLSRLMVLGLLANQGARHGHQIRRDAEQTEVSRWGGVNVGALYRELRLMEEEGLVEPLRTEKVGRRPARTVYQITEEGRRELAILRERAIRDPVKSPDALSVALLFGGVWDKAELAALLRARRQILAGVLEHLATERIRGQEKGYCGPIDATVFRRGELHLEAELKWHDEFEKVLAGLPDPASRTGKKPGKKRRDEPCS